MRHELIVLDTPGQVASLTARTIAGLLGDLTSGSQRNGAVAFSGGKTPATMLEILGRFAGDPGEAAANGEPFLDWRAVDVFQVDERIAPPGDPARNLTSLSSHLLTNRVPKENSHPIPVELGDVEAPDAYSATLERVLGRTASIDVVHLGLGADGHTASLIPGDPVLDVGDRDVAATLDYQGHRRVTLTYPMLNRAKVLVWQIVGDSKATALGQLLDGDASIPAGRVKANRSIIIADRTAAAHA